MFALTKMAAPRVCTNKDGEVFQRMMFDLQARVDPGWGEKMGRTLPK